MEKRIINPWHWQEQQGWSWAVETNNAQRVLYCAGQVSVDANGRPTHAGDMRAQIKLAMAFRMSCDLITTPQTPTS